MIKQIFWKFFMKKCLYDTNFSNFNWKKVYLHTLFTLSLTTSHLYSHILSFALSNVYVCMCVNGSVRFPAVLHIAVPIVKYNKWKYRKMEDFFHQYSILSVFPVSINLMDYNYLSTENKSRIALGGTILRALLWKNVHLF